MNMFFFLFRNYNPKDGRRGKPISKEEAMKELIEVVSAFVMAQRFQKQSALEFLIPFSCSIFICRFEI
jgi:hypothetical protein